MKTITKATPLIWSKLCLDLEMEMYVNKDAIGTHRSIVKEPCDSLVDRGWSLTWYIPDHMTSGK